MNRASSGMRGVSTAFALVFVAASLSGCFGGKDEPVSAPALCATQPGPAVPSTFKPELPRVKLETSVGEIVLELYREEAPITVGNFLNLTSKGVYDGVLFHRVIGPAKQPPKGFMLQTGDPNTKDKDPSTWGRGGPGYQIPDEFNPLLRHGELAVSMANSGPNSGGSQFFITLAPTPWLDDKHAVFGRVASGAGVVREIGQVETDENDRPKTPVKIIRATILEPAEAQPVRHIVRAHAVITDKKTEPGRPAAFIIVAENLGNVRDNLAFTADVPKGWGCAFEVPSVHVPATASRAALVTLTPPAGAGEGEHVARVRVHSETDPTQAWEVPLKVRVGKLGAAAREGVTVTGNYVGVLADGRLFDTSLRAVAANESMARSAFWGKDEDHRFDAFPFTVGDGVIEGFSELATGAKEGEVRAGRIPVEKAYGERGAPLSGRVLLFELEIVKVHG